MASRNIENTFVTVRHILTPDELQYINSSFVKLGKIDRYLLTWQIGCVEVLWLGKNILAGPIWGQILEILLFKTAHSGVLNIFSDSRVSPNVESPR